ncbi:MAG: flippase [Bacteroidota bacterium]
MMDSDRLNTIQGSNLAKNTIWNFIGIISPAVAALISVPFLIKGIGTDRFGLLTLIWVAIGYFGIFDFGIGKALTKIVADRKALKDDGELSSIIFNASVLLGILGIFAGSLLYFTADTVIDLLKVRGNLKSEGLRSIYILSFSMPFVISSVGFRGVLEGFHCFNLVNIVRIPMGALFYLGPLALLPFTNDLFSVVVFLVVLRIITWLMYFIFSNKYVNILKVRSSFNVASLKPLLKFGGWLTITNVVSPLLVSFDRYIISGLLTISVVAYYTTSLELVVKFWMIPAAIVTVLFPAFSSVYMTDRKRTHDLFFQGIKYVYIFLFPLALFCVFFAREALTLWLGSDFASRSFVVLQVLSVGAFIYGIDNVPAEFLNSVGVPQFTTLVRIMELPVYLVLLYYLTIKWGIVGAAVAWVIRIMIDTVLLFWKSFSILNLKFNGRDKLLYLTVISFALSLVMQSLIAKMLLYCLCVTVSFCIIWKRFSEGEMRFFRSLLEKFTKASI